MSCELTLEQLAEATSGTITSLHNKAFSGVTTDSREDVSGKLFIALKGDLHDGHQYINDVISKGAAAVLIHDESQMDKDLKPKTSVVVVSDTLRGLQDLAQYWRKKIKAKFVGITGSNGKTTTKEFLNSILKTQYKTYASKKSFNNHWGVPISILEVSSDDEVAILEMGMNHPGELTRLSEIAKPDIVTCVTVARAHIGHFEGGIKGIAKAKAEIYDSNPQAEQIYNYDNEHTNEMFKKVSSNKSIKTRAFSAYSAGAEVSLRAQKMTLESLVVKGQIGGVQGQCEVPVFGRHNTVNLMAASSLALAIGMEPDSIWAALPLCKTNWGRGELIKLPAGATLIFDAYNANPDSMATLVKNIFELPCEGKKVAVIGEMLELGKDSDSYHKELGEMLANTDFKLVCFIGSTGKAFEEGYLVSGNPKNLIITDAYEDSLAIKLQSMLNPQDIVVMKGSRGVKLERFLKVWNP